MNNIKYVISLILISFTLVACKPIPDISDEDLAEYSYFDLLFLKSDNPQLKGDIVSMCWGDPIIWVIVDPGVGGELSYYIRDIDGNTIGKRTSDFSNDVYICNYRVVLYTPSVDILHLSVNQRDYESVTDDDLHETSCLAFMDYEDTHYALYLQGRGNSSWGGTDKKSFTLRFSKRVPLLDDGNTHKKYNLIGMAHDRTLLKNLMFNHLADAIGIPYQPNMKLVVLIVNSEYRGVYLLTTKITVDSKRVALSPGEMFIRFDPPDVDGAIPYESTWKDEEHRQNTFELLYPEHYDDAYAQQAQKRVQRVISAIDDTSSSDYLKYVDLDNLAKYYLIQEISMNCDAMHRSVYAYWKDDKLFYGPVWDMDLTLGSLFEKLNMNWVFPDKMYVRYTGIYKSLWQHPEFVDRVKKLYRDEVRYECYSLIDYANNIKGLIVEDAEMNFRVFTQEESVGAIQYTGKDYVEYTDSMLRFYRQRLEFLDKVFN